MKFPLKEVLKNSSSEFNVNSVIKKEKTANEDFFRSEENLYIEKFRNEIILIKISGKLINSNNLPSIIKDITFLSKNGAKIIIVHGGGKQADRFSKKLGIKVKKINGRRITCLDTLNVVNMCFNKINTEIIAFLRTYNVKPVGLCGIDAGFKVKKRDVREIDYGFVGDIQGIDCKLLELLLVNNYIPVICPLASDANGIVLNINADTITLEIAKNLSVKKVIIMSDVPGVLETVNNKTVLIPYLSLSKVVEMIKNETVTGGMVTKLENCVSAIRNGVDRVHLINGRNEFALLKEVYTSKSIGTMILDDSQLDAYKNELE